MLGQILSRFALPPGQAWLAPLAGLVTMGLALLMVRVLANRRTSRPPRELEAAPPPGEHERRQSPRRGGRPVKVLISNPEVTANPQVGWVQNRSAGGLCLAVTQQFEVGEILSVRAARAKKSASWVQVEVMYCYLREESWLIGCKFVSVPSWNIQLLFD